MRIGILGGTFNPPHLGHLILAQDILGKLNLDTIFFVPTNISPHKERDEVGSKYRLNMLALAIEGQRQFQIKDLELRRGGVSYTVDTIHALREEYSNDELFLIVGSDLAQDINSWKDYQGLKKNVKIVVAQRCDTPAEKKDDFIFVDIIQIGISSSKIRKMIKKGMKIKNLVRDEVLEYIENNNLYRKE
ncbi:MAG: nicotinate (nicotinamide) nucleotide adenylyltransferase [Candidatus Omnitrophica bacterium]|nr:nicotinate (nicotinamide) nucleotide adenylyltransferase [Candidatus Omnitrophota bacterium]